MKRLINSSLLIGTVLAATVFAASAQTATPETDAVARVDTSQSTEPANEADTDCLRSTGSRIVAQRNHDRDVDEAADCVAVNGRVYTREDLDRVGGVDTADALRKLDPAIR